METGGAPDRNPLISELTHGKELARQLETHLEQSAPPELCKPLVQSLLSTCDRAIALARSPSEGSAGSVGEAFPEEERREVCGKRKTPETWTREVRVCSVDCLEGRLEDGFSWRKYGQKDILGAHHPRGYYRCTHRNTQGCLATKQVQRSDDDPFLFHVTYRGNHTCCPLPRETSTPDPSTASEQQRRRRWQQQQQQKVTQQPPNEGDDDNADGPLLLSFRTALTVKTEGDLDASSSSFSFPPAHVYSPPLPEQFPGSFSPPFLSPGDSGQDLHFPASAWQQAGGVGGGPSGETPESDLAGVFGAATSAADSPVVDLGFMLDPAEYDPNFPFDDSLFP